MTTNLHRFTHTLQQMCRTLIPNVCPRIFFPTSVKRNYSSALYISGNKAYKAFAFLSPYLDCDKRFANMDKLQKELALRRMNVDIVQLKNAWDFYRKMIADKCALEENNSELANRKRKLLERTDHTAEQKQELDKLQIQLNIVRQDLKMLKETIWDLDEDVIERILKLPNELDPRTPTNESVVLKSAPESFKENRRSHIDIGTSLDLLDYKNPMCYYLCNNAALFELAVLAHVSRVFDKNNMIKMIGTDFSRSLVVEASGLNHEDPMATFIIENHNEVERGSPNRMHLVGGASLVSFLILHTKQLINPNYFPLKYFATGRQYMPLSRDTHACGLFTVCQASVAHAFVMVKDPKSEEYETQFNKLLENVCRLYDDLCSHYRVVMRSASELQPCESLRVSFEMWSPFANQYIEIGHVSAYSNYLSKRLLIAYQTPSGRDFPAIISGTVLSVPRLLACLLEQNPDKFVVPPKIAELMLSDDYITT